MTKKSLIKKSSQSVVVISGPSIDMLNITKTLKKLKSKNISIKGSGAVRCSGGCPTSGSTAYM